ncbi:hypothetical protein [Aquabacter cavernae]|uniref:hypothetical protein n=1 Tax=Aquabacter cavernae TaxID=2496029 RepID=UPI000F8C57FB|nr:hypothetical protein [Aquabacter cavernae]
MRYDGYEELDLELLELRADWAELALELVLLKQAVRAKANFNPNQPRVPAGHEDGGSWTDGNYGPPTRSGPRRVAPKPPPLPAATKPSPEAHLPPQDGTGKPAPAWDGPARVRPTFDVALPVLKEPGLPPHILASAPKVPEQRPPTPQERFRTVRAVAFWASKVTLQSGGNPRAIALRLLAEGAHWLVQEYWPYVSEYLEPPKSLAQLRADVRAPRPGTEVHHIVEQTSAIRAGYSRDLVHHPDNLVRISTLRHWAISAWYQIRHERFENITPRDYLRDKPWHVRYEIGLEALQEHGILAR